MHRRNAAQAAWHTFASPEKLAEVLAGRVAAELEAAVRERGLAAVAVSGGKTPVRMFRALSRRQIDWRSVVVTLVDERFVPPGDTRSNARLVTENLLVGKAAEASFLPLYRPAESLEQAARAAELVLADLPRPLDVAVLGMGTDGHSASFFPDAPDLTALIENKGGRTVLPVVAPSAGEPRLTLSLQRLCAARFVALHIEGEEKRQVLSAALERRDRPVSAFFDHAGSGIEIYWAP